MPTNTDRLQINRTTNAPTVGLKNGRSPTQAYPPTIRPIKITRNAPALPSIVVRIKPFDFFGPGINMRVMTPAINPIRMLQEIRNKIEALPTSIAKGSRLVGNNKATGETAKKVAIESTTKLAARTAPPTKIAATIISLINSQIFWVSFILMPLCSDSSDKSIHRLCGASVD